MKFFAIWISLFSLICSAMGQTINSSNAQQIVALASQEAPQGPDQNTIAPVEGSKISSSSETKTLPTDLNATNASSSNPETNTNGIVPTDPSMIPPPVSTEDPANAPLPVDPNAGSATETLSEELSPVNNTESIEKKKHEIKVRYNQVRTQVEKEEAVVALRQAADKATTPEGQRQALKAYYELLFKRMKHVDPSLSERCDVMQGAYLRRIEQNGVEPTIPLSLPANSTINSTNIPTLPPSKGKSHKKHSTSNLAQ